jgi:hypothetical protein
MECKKAYFFLEQGFLGAALQPSPGLATGTLVNSTVFLLGITVLLRGDQGLSKLNNVLI